MYIIGIGMLWYLIVKMNLNTSVLSSAHYNSYFLLAMLLVSISPLIGALRAIYLLSALEVKVPPLKNIAKIEWINKFIYNITPAKLNVPTKAVLYNKLCAVDLRKGMTFVTFEYFLDVILMLLIAAVGGYVVFQNIENVSTLSIGYLIGALLIGAVVFFSMPLRAFNFLIKKADKIHSVRIKKGIIFALDTLKTLKSVGVSLMFSKHLTIILLFSAIIATLPTIILSLLFLSIGHSVPVIWTLAITNSAIIVSGVTGIPGGIGIREASMVYLFSMLGIPVEVSTLAVLLARGLTIIPIVTGYALAAHVGVNKLSLR